MPGGNGAFRLRAGSRNGGTNWQKGLAPCNQIRLIMKYGFFYKFWVRYYLICSRKNSLMYLPSWHEQPGQVAAKIYNGFSTRTHARLLRHPHECSCGIGASQFAHEGDLVLRRASHQVSEIYFYIDLDGDIYFLVSHFNLNRNNFGPWLVDSPKD